MLKEFKEFAFKGNMVDLAVGVIIGGAFGNVVTSLVNKFSVLKEGKTPGPYETLEAAKKAGAIALSYGSFTTILINFLIVALAIFFIVKAIQKAKGEKKAEEAPKGPTEVELLGEIRDLLKKEKKKEKESKQEG
jgi:large conductance mechanosensitive channel